MTHLGDVDAIVERWRFTDLSREGVEVRVFGSWNPEACVEAIRNGRNDVAVLANRIYELEEELHAWRGPGQ